VAPATRRAPSRAYHLPQDPAAREEIFRIWREVEAEYAVVSEDELAALEAAEYVDDPEDDEAMAEIHRMKWRNTARFGHDMRRYGEYMREAQRRIAHLVQWVTLDGDEDADEPGG
jgi:hypothetical protein